MVVYVANPLYDAVFKYLMEDDRIAKTILTALLKKKVIDVKIRRNEYANLTRRESISMFRIDFAATVLDEDNQPHLMLIELQKTWLPTETLRFRRYLALQYNNEENMLKEEHEKYAIPMVAIYLLGHCVGKIEEPASSGLQSIVPLLTLIDWLAKGIYQENKPYSFEEIEKIRHLLDEVGKDLSLSDNESLTERLAGIVSVWQISDGSLIDIKDGRTNTIGKHYFNDVMNDILDDYYLMVPYLKIAKS